MICKRIAVILFVIYGLAFFSYFLYASNNVEPERRVFTKKELSDGPLVLKKGLSSGKGTILKATIIDRTAFDGPANDGSISSLEQKNISIPEIGKKVTENFIKMAKNVSSNGERLLYFTFSNAAFTRLTLNWLCNTAKFKEVHQGLLVVGTTSDVCDDIKHDWKQVACFNLRLDGFDDSSEWGSRKYVDILAARIQLMLALAKENIPFLLFETDAVWLRNPHEYFLNQTLIDDADIVVPLKGYNTKWDTLSFDPMLAFPTNATKALFRKTVSEIKSNPKTYDQDVLNELCQSQYFGVICRDFEWEDVADGKWFKLSESERGELRPYVVNNNYYVGVHNKEARQALNGLWFLTKAGHCMESKVERALTRYE